MLVIFCYLVLYYVRTVSAFGVGFHLTQVGRLVSHPDSYLKSGSIFPESFSLYTSNEVNWDWFLETGSRLWHEKYLDGKDDHGLRSFLRGVYVGKKISELQNVTEHGLVSLLSELEFDGSMEDAISYLRGPADLIHLSNVLNEESQVWGYFLSTQIRLPLKDDIMYILSTQGVNTSWTSVVNNMFKILGILQSELYLLKHERIRTLNVAHSICPGGPEITRNHPTGGEFSILSTLYSNNATGSINPAYSNDAVFDEDQAILKAFDTISSKDSYLTPLQRISLFGSSIATGKFLSSDELCLAIGSPLEAGHGSVYIIPLGSRMIRSEVQEKSRVLYGSKAHKLHLLDRDYLVISAGGSSEIFFYLAGEKVLTIKDCSWHQEVSSVKDLDFDGIPELILTCPYCYDDEIGKSTIIPGANILHYLNSSRRDQTVELDAIGIILLHGPESLKYQHFGRSTVASKNFLLISAQNLGLVYGYALKQLNTATLPTFYMKEDSIFLPDEDLPWKWTTVPSSDHGYYGSTMYSWSVNGDSYVAISQPLFNKVFIYKDVGSSALEVWLTLVLDHLIDLETVKTSIGFGKGICFSAEKNKLYLTSPGSFKGSGAIWSVSMYEMKRAVEWWRAKRLIVSVIKHLELINPSNINNGWNNFGDNILTTPHSQLVVTAPFYGYGDLNDLPLIGAIFIH